MLSIKYIRENEDIVRHSLKAKKSDIDFLFKILRELGEKASVLIA